MPAAAVIPAPVAYINDVAVKKLVVDNHLTQCTVQQWSGSWLWVVIRAFFRHACVFGVSSFGHNLRQARSLPARVLVSDP